MVSLDNFDRLDDLGRIENKECRIKGSYLQKKRVIVA